MPTPFASTSEIVVLGDYQNNGTYYAERRGTLASGKQRKPRYSIEIKSEPLLHNFDDMMLGRGPADAIAELISTQIKNISEQARPATLADRQKNFLEFQRGAPNAVKRYSGGRLGSMPPNPDSRTLFNDSGRLAKSIFATQNKTDKTYTINVAANRLTIASLGPRAAEIVARLVQLVPAMDPAKLPGYKVIEDSIRASISDMLAKATDRQQLLLKRLAAERKNALIALGRSVFGGITSPVR